jgi:hypothetical protein
VLLRSRPFRSAPLPTITTTLPKVTTTLPGHDDVAGGHDDCRRSTLPKVDDAAGGATTLPSHDLAEATALPNATHHAEDYDCPGRLRPA